MNGGKDPHQGKEVLIGTDSRVHVRTFFYSPSKKTVCLIKKQKVSTSVCEALTANSSQIHTYQSGADSSNELMVSSGAYRRRGSVADESKAAICFIRGEK